VVICRFATKLLFVRADITTDMSLKMKDTVDRIIQMLGAPRNYGMCSVPCINRSFRYRSINMITALVVDAVL